MKKPGGNVQKETVSGEALGQEQAQVAGRQGRYRAAAARGSPVYAQCSARAAKGHSSCV